MPFFARLYLKYYLNCFHVNDILILLQIHDIPPMQQSETTSFLNTNVYSFSIFCSERCVIQ